MVKKERIGIVVSNKPEKTIVVAIQTRYQHPKYNKTLMKKVLDKYIQDDYILVGISNQSGVDKGLLSYDMMVKCFNKTLELLDITFEIFACTHKNVPITCYCRKPQIGNFIIASLKYKINFKNSIYIGDRTTDKTCATKLHMKYIDADNFFIN